MAIGSALPESLGASIPDAHGAALWRGENLLVLTHDAMLIDIAKQCAGEHEVLAVSGESALADRLAGGNAGVVILDAAAVTSSIATLVGHLQAQFPDLVLIVAGGTEHQSVLATQIVHGSVYRFLHKPVSDQRVKLFLEAAWKRHEEWTGNQSGTGAPNEPGAARRPDGAVPVKLLSGLGIAVLAGVIGWLLLARSSPRAPVSNAPVTQAPTPAARDEVLEDLLARAQAAFVAGALVSPPGHAAADLFRQAMQRNPKDPRAAEALDRIVGHLLSGAETELAQHHLGEAQRRADQAHAIRPENAGAAFLATRIGKERERMLAARARHAASSEAMPVAASGEPSQPAAQSEPGPATPPTTASPPVQTSPPVDAPSSQAAVTAPATLPPATSMASAVALEVPAQPVTSAGATTLPAAAASVSAAPTAAPEAPLQLIHYSAPVFPMSARERSLTGWVEVVFDVRTDGSVANAAVAAAEPAGVFDRAALDAVRKWRYRPVIRDGHPVPQHARLRVRFALEG